jgi:hypothetical protein
MENREIDLAKLKEEINSTASLRNIGIIISKIPEESKTARQELIKFLNLTALKEKIDESNDLFGIGMSISSIAHVDRGVAEMLLKFIDIRKLARKIDDEDELIFIDECISRIIFVNKEYAKELISYINIGKLKDNIDEKDEFIYFIGLIFDSIARIDKKTSKRLASSIDIQKLLKKFEKEEIKLVGWCIARVTRASFEIGEDLLKSIKKKKKLRNS